MKSYKDKTVLSNFVNYKNTAKFVDDISSTWANTPIIRQFSKQLFKYKNPMKVLYDFLRRTTSYDQDNTDQTLRNPNRLLNDDLANCVDTTIFTSSILKNQDIPHMYKMVAPYGGSPTHIYIKIKDFAMDPINGRSEDDPNNLDNLFGIEVQHMDSYIYKPKF